MKRLKSTTPAGMVVILPNTQKGDMMTKNEGLVIKCLRDSVNCSAVDDDGRHYFTVQSIIRGINGDDTGAFEESIMELVEREKRMDKSNAHKLLNRMVEKGLIEKKSMPVDIQRFKSVRRAKGGALMQEQISNCFTLPN